MDKWDVKLANMFKARNNPNIQGITKGKVITGIPALSVSIGEEIVLDMEDLVIANGLYHLPEPLRAGDDVILIPDDTGQMYFVIDKAGA